MTPRTRCAAMLFILPLFLFLPQCKPKDPTPPVPKAASAPPSNIPSPSAQTGVSPTCVGLGCEKKECIGMGCGDSAPKCIGMGCKKEPASKTPAPKP